MKIEYKDNLTKRDMERIKYNEKHGTNFSYGQYFSYKKYGLLPKEGIKSEKAKR